MVGNTNLKQAVVFLTQVVFLLGHDLLAGTIWCKVVAIALHYFYLCAFAWMFIEGIHLYRMMTDKPGIDHGQVWNNANEHSPSLYPLIGEWLKVDEPF